MKRELLCKLLPMVAVSTILGFYATVQTRNFTPAFWEEDHGGYVFLAKRIAAGGPLLVRPDNPFQHHSHPWVENENGEVTAKYAPGYPTLMALFYLIGGDWAMLLVNPLAGGLVLIGAYLLFREWMGTLASVLAVLTLATNDAFLSYTRHALPHATNLCFITWGMFFLWRWLREPGEVPGIAAGLALGYACTVRHVSVLLALCVVVAVVSALRRGRGTGSYPAQAALSLGLAYCLFPILLATYNTALFGNPWTTGYGLSGEQGAFGLRLLSRNFMLHNRHICEFILFLAFPIGFIGIVAVGKWTDRLIRLLWFGSVYVIYGSYYWYTPSPAFYRFYIPLMPLFTGMSYALLDRLKVGRTARWAGMVALALVMVLSSLDTIKWSLRGAHRNGMLHRYVIPTRLVTSALQPDAIVFAGGALYHCVGPLKEFSSYNLNAFLKSHGTDTFPDPGDDALANDHVSTRIRIQQTRAQRLREFYEVATEDELQAAKLALVERGLSDGRQVAFFLPKDQAEAERAALGKEFVFAPLGECEVRRWGRGATIWALYEVQHE